MLSGKLPHFSEPFFIFKMEDHPQFSSEGSFLSLVVFPFFGA